MAVFPGESHGGLEFGTLYLWPNCGGCLRRLESTWESPSDLLLIQKMSPIHCGCLLTTKERKVCLSSGGRVPGCLCAGDVEEGTVAWPSRHDGFITSGGSTCPFFGGTGV